MKEITYFSVATVDHFEDKDVEDGTWKFSYSMEPINGNMSPEIKSIYIPAEKEFDIYDVTSLKDLEFLEIKVTDLEGISSMAEFSKLKYFKGDFSYANDIIVKKKNIKGLNVNYIHTNELDLLSEYSNLETLSMSLSDDITDFSEFQKLSKLKNISITGSENNLSWLSGVKELKVLELENTKNIKTSTLAKLTKLEKLSIMKNDQLKELSFLKNLTNLSELSLSNTSIKDINSITGHTKLTSLSLMDNSSVLDYSAINGLINLKKLKLDTDVDAKNIPEMAQFKSLETLSIDKQFRKVIIGNTSIKDLTLIGGRGGKDSDNEIFYEGFPQIEKVTIKKEDDMGSTINWKMATSVKEIVFGDSSIYGGGTVPVISDFSFGPPKIETVQSGYFFLELPNLEKVTLVNTSLSFEAEDLPKTSTIKSFELSDGVSVGNSNMNDLLNTIANYTQLTSLSLPNREITDLSFLENLSNLERINLRDNFVTDYSSLANLPKLKMVNLDKNPIQKDTSIKDSVIIK